MTQILPNRLKELRVRQGLAQSQLARMANVSKAAISSYENGMRQPSYDILIRLASIFRVSTDYLLGVTHERFLDVSNLTEKNILLIQDVVEALREKNGGPAEPSK